MIKKLLEKLNESLHKHVGSWAYFIGSVIADGYVDRMLEINEESLDEMEAEEAKEIGVDLGAIEKPKDFGSN